MVAAGVVEEKTSRVVELLLATIKPLHLLWGKIVGIGLMAFAQVVLLGGTALVAALATGILDVPTAAGSMFVAVVIWFVLGFVFFATLYAQRAQWCRDRRSSDRVRPRSPSLRWRLCTRPTSASAPSTAR